MPSACRLQGVYKLLVHDFTIYIQNPHRNVFFVTCDKKFKKKQQQQPFELVQIKCLCKNVVIINDHHIAI